MAIRFIIYESYEPRSPETLPARGSHFMMQLFKEVISPKSSKAKAEELKGKAAEERPETTGSAAESAQEKGKHGDPGVCCGGCS